MNTSQTATWLTRPAEHVRTPRRAEAFIEARNRGQLHQLLLSEFVASGMSQIELSRRTGKPRETISRLLGHPNNMEVDTASKMLFAMTGKALSFATYNPLEAPARETNRDHRPHWAEPPLEKRKKRTHHIVVPSHTTETSTDATASEIRTLERV